MSKITIAELAKYDRPSKWVDPYTERIEFDFFDRLSLKKS